MANKMTIKRGLLKAFVLGVLQGYDARYTLEDRLRMATFQQTSRAERIAIMGEDYTYGEVLYRPNEAAPDERTSGSTTRKPDHRFEMHIWRKFEDADTYESSSQSLWDNIIEADDGVLNSLENKSHFKDAGHTYVVSRPTGIRSHEVLMDNNPLELAHYLTFRITVKG